MCRLFLIKTKYDSFQKILLEEFPPELKSKYFDSNLIWLNLK